MDRCKDTDGKPRAKTLEALRGIVVHQPHSETAGRVAIWLWMEDPEFAARAECATAHMAADLRAMQPETRRLWRTLLLEADLGRQERPSREWLERCRKRMVQLGEPAFQHYAIRWLNAIPASARTAGERLPITRLGSHMLKSLLWWTTIARNPHLDDAVVRLAGARWERAVRNRRIAGAVAFAVSQMHEATQMPSVVIEAPEAELQYLSPPI
ncbi:MAG: hypothetical protein R2729_14690 [Bryobacteraceae bacterium]